ncbi:MAG: hypothetical protein HFG22_02675 [Lachnospiraceae bacterium]|nr:hypothetical protein [Lachnospiraceae bacterium]
MISRKGLTMTAMLLTIALSSGCQTGAKKTEAMDFQAQVEWKAPDPAVSKRPKILFVGNSYTFYNNFTTMFVNIIDAQDRKSDVYELSQTYYTLKRFADPEDRTGMKLDKALQAIKWDIVIFQEDTSMALASAAEKEMYPYARILDEKVKAVGGQTAFLMTWAPKNGIQNGLKKYGREEVQAQLADSYMTIADELDSLLIPVGVGFMRCAAEYPEIELWDTDGVHPSTAGTYLAACTTYALVYQESPENCTYLGKLDQDVATKLQKVAADMILN